MRNLTASPNPLPPLELWGGIEPTINRVQDRYLSQDTRTHHSQRIEDLDLFASLGIKTMRYPVLWEATAPEGLESANWTFADERLPRLRELGIRPIVGLVHHGSGPRYTSLTDPEFPDKLAAYARAVATRFPWVKDWTPVNEPMTTARFSGIDGVWYPHGDNDQVMLRCLVNECLGIVRSMRAIRSVIPDARLIQTDDVGKHFGTKNMQDMVAFKNERRWLSYDLLFGRVDEQHSMYQYLLDHHIKQKELAEFRLNPCPPDIVGLNYYVRSERFMDDRLDRYPPDLQTEYQHRKFVDLDVARIAVEGMSGFDTLFDEAWARYHTPIVVTETHLGSFRDEEVRWVWQIWQEAQAARQRGIAVQAVTLWALLGVFSWGNLSTEEDGQYEPGAFDLRAPTPRPTALAHLARALTAGEQPALPVLTTPGWWKRWQRLQYPPFRLATLSDYTGAPLVQEPGPTGQPVLITGGLGELARCFIRVCELRGLPFRALSHEELDITDPAAIERALAMFKPWAVLNTAGIHDPDAAEGRPDWARQALAEGPATLADACARHGIRMVMFSTDQVFDGQKRAPYVESDPVNPLSVYGRCAAEGERQVLARCEQALVVRTGLHFSPYEERNLLARALNALATDEPYASAGDCIVTATYVPDLCNDTLDLLLDRETGIWHHAHPQPMSWTGLIRLAARVTGINAGQLATRPLAAFRLAAPRAPYSVLGSERGVLPPPLKQGLGRYCSDCQVGWVTEVDPEVRCSGAPKPTRMG